MMADLDAPLLEQLLGYLGVEVTDSSLPAWRRSRAQTLVLRLEKLKAALSQTDREK